MRKSVKVTLGILAASVVSAVVMRWTGWYQGAVSTPLTAALGLAGFAALMTSIGINVMVPGAHRARAALLDMASTALFAIVAVLEGHPLVAGFLASYFFAQAYMHARLIGLVRFVPAGGRVPRFYGRAWDSMPMRGSYYAPKPLHVAIGKARAMLGWRDGFGQPAK